MNKLYKQNGKEMSVNDNSLEYALSLGWTKNKPSPNTAQKHKTKSTSEQSSAIKTHK